MIRQIKNIYAEISRLTFEVIKKFPLKQKNVSYSHKWIESKERDEGGREGEIGQKSEGGSKR